jgi:hypothetical protein
LRKLVKGWSVAILPEDTCMDVALYATPNQISNKTSLNPL